MERDRMQQLYRAVDDVTQEFINEAMEGLTERFKDIPEEVIRDHLRGSLAYWEYKLLGMNQ